MKADTDPRVKDKAPESCTIAIIGSGFSGLGMAIRLKKSGIDDFLILERSCDVGGVWRETTYPGCACDVQSQLYSFSFVPNPHWSRKYSPQQEILAYLQNCAERFQLVPHLRFRSELMRADWNGSMWTLATAQGIIRSRFLISATGAFSDAAYPNIPGLASFQGELMHSARWNHAYDLRGKRVAAIGTGASAIQFIPEVQKVAAHLSVFQRSAAYIIPREDHLISEGRKGRYHDHPWTLKLKRIGLFWKYETLGISFRHPNVMRYGRKMALAHMHRQVKDPELRRKLTPHYEFGCKRVLVSDNFYPALTQENVDVVCDPIEAITPEGILVDGDISPRPFDAILLGTGYSVSDFPMAYRFFNASGTALSDVWQGSPKAFLGTTIDAFPNFFSLLGPNTGLGHSSVVLMIEAQIAWILQAITYMREHGYQRLLPQSEAFRIYQDELDRRSAQTIWLKGNCQSWYLDKTGRNSSLWPRSIPAFKRRLRFDPKDCLFE